MLALDVRFEGFQTEDWRRVLALFQPRRPASEERDPSRARGGVIAVHHGGRLLKLVHTQVGRLRLDDLREAFPVSAAEIAHRHHASWAATLERGALDAIMEGFGARTRRGDDLTTQAVTLVTLARAELAAGRIELWPQRLRGVPIPSPAMIDGTLDAVCPRGRTLLVGLFEGSDLWTCLALRRGPSGFDLVLGPDELRADMGLLAGDWRRDCRHLARVVEDRTGPLALGCYAEVGTLRRLAVDATPGAWARAAAVRDLILHPLPIPLAIPLGVDVGLAAFAAIRDVAERIDPIGVLDWLTGRPPEEPGDHDAERPAPQGFHPLELLRKMLSRER